ncbi:MAG TPA: arginine--tRNA ligase [Actinophytocola sp.]
MSQKAVDQGWDDEDPSKEDATVQTVEVVPLLDQVSGAVSTAIASTRPELAGADPLVRRSEHADFQSNAALALAKRAGVRPADLATDLASTLTVGSVALSGPGFLNITLGDRAMWTQMAARLGPGLGVGRPLSGRRTIVDYSAPNIAKEMHVGHLRTTILGDCLARVLAFLGGDVVRQNHLGDWGTQFGMLIQYMDEVPATAPYDELYRASRARFDADADFADRCRRRVVALQAGDPATLARWRDIVAESEQAFHAIYARLGVLLTPADSVGESFYNPMLADTVADLVAAGIAVASDGALVVYSRHVLGREGEPVPLMVRKSDGGYGYDTTDLATIRYRVRELAPDQLLYVTDARQAQHFALVFEAARRAGWLPDTVDVAHVAYGMVLGLDGRPFRTRAGDTVRLTDLVDEAVARARTVVAEKNPGLAPATLDRIAEQTGIGAVKYADLSTSRTKDYAFDVDRMVSFAGNTGVYLQFAHARVRSILRKAGATTHAVDPEVPLHPTERTLVLAIDGFSTALTEVAATLEPHRLCNYLYELARACTAFCEECPVLRAAEPVRANRIALCHLTAATLRDGLELLGIAAPESM